jgi:hypothetical protein
LLIDGVSLSEDKPSADHSRKERICTSFFSRVHFALQQEGGFVDGDKFAEVERMLPGGVDHKPDAIPPSRKGRDQSVPRGGEYHTVTGLIRWAYLRSITMKDQSHNQGMGKSDFGSIHQAVPSPFEDG